MVRLGDHDNYPCHKLPKDKWCDHSGPGGFMGHTCKPATQKPIDDVVEGRGPWMTTSRGERFFPLDPREEDIFIEDIANGLALDCRYNGQGNVNVWYSVAEHCVLMTKYAGSVLCWPMLKCLAVLLHDAPEAYINDLNRATKQAMRALADGWGGRRKSDYDVMSDSIERVIFNRYGIHEHFNGWAKDIKELDCRIVMNEKPVVINNTDYPSAYDQFEPLELEVHCWKPPEAKHRFLRMYETLTGDKVL